MLAWLRTHTQLRERVATLEKVVAQLEARERDLLSLLHQETDDNRLREDKLVEQVVLLARGETKQSPPPHIPHRRVRQSPAGEAESVVWDEELHEKEPEVTEEEIDSIARQYYEQARANGIDYDYEILKATIRQNPDKYL